MKQTRNCPCSRLEPRPPPAALRGGLRTSGARTALLGLPGPTPRVKAPQHVALDPRRRKRGRVCACAARSGLPAPGSRRSPHGSSLQEDRQEVRRTGEVTSRAKNPVTGPGTCPGPGRKSRLLSLDLPGHERDGLALSPRSTSRCVRCEEAGLTASSGPDKSFRTRKTRSGTRSSAARL